MQVTIRAKNIKASPFVDEKSLARLLERLSAHTEFKTQNKGKPNMLFVKSRVKRVKILLAASCTVRYVNENVNAF